MTGTPSFTWTGLVPFSAGQAVALEIRRFVFSIKGSGTVTALTDDTVGIHMHVPPQLGVEEVALDLALTSRGAEDGNGLRLDTTRKGQTRRLDHDVRMRVVSPDKVRVERAATAAGEKDMAFTIGRSGMVLTIGAIGGFGQLDGATITIRAGQTADEASL